MIDSISLADWKLLARSEQDQIAMQRLLLHLSPQQSGDFVALVERAVSFVIGEMTVDPSSRQGMSEDELTEVVRFGLFCLGFNATHDTKTGGHCDLVVEELGKLRWLGEAKKIDSINNSHLFDGYLQLTTRYANGIRGQGHGGLLIFSYAPGNRAVLESWSKYLTAQRSTVTNILEMYADGYFRTTEDLVSTGLPYLVKHHIVQLHHQPEK